jgi:hypothetical protein
MPTMSNYFDFIMINLAFIAQITLMVYFRSSLDIKENFAIYKYRRCFIDKGSCL